MKKAPHTLFFIFSTFTLTTSCMYHMNDYVRMNKNYDSLKKWTREYFLTKKLIQQNSRFEIPRIQEAINSMETLQQKVERSELINYLLEKRQSSNLTLELTAVTETISELTKKLLNLIASQNSIPFPRALKDGLVGNTDLKLISKSSLHDTIKQLIRALNRYEMYGEIGEDLPQDMHMEAFIKNEVFQLLQKLRSATNAIQDPGNDRIMHNETAPHQESSNSSSNGSSDDELF